MEGNLTYRERHAKAAIEANAAYGTPFSKYARDNGIKASTFDSWVRAYRTKQEQQKQEKDQ